MVHFNDPNWGKAAANLAAAFAPPSGQEIAGFARAGLLQTQRHAADAEAQRLADFWAAANDPNFDQSRFDRMGMAIPGGWNPNQSYYAVDTQDATNRRGQDVQATTARRGQDVQAGTARAVAAANNARALETARLGAQQSLISNAFGALNPGQVAPAIPEGLLADFGLPGIEERRGDPRPLNESELRAAILSGMEPELQQAHAFGNTPIETIIMEDGPSYATRPQALGQSAPAPSSGTVRMYQTTDGGVGRTTDGLADMVTGEAIPADARVGTLSDSSESFGSSELSNARQEVLARRAGVDSMLQQVATLDQQLAQADSAQAVGVIGSASRVLNDLATQAEAALQATGIAAPAELRNVQRYQDTFRAMGVQNAVTQSSILDLAYSIAQSREPGRLTENDIDRALRTIGGNLQDPVAMRQVLHSAAQRATTDYRSFERTMMGAYGDAFNLQPAQFPELRAPGSMQPRPDAQTSAPAPTAQVLRPGDVVDGFRFIGGPGDNPNDEKLWEPVQ